MAAAHTVVTSNSATWDMIEGFLSGLGDPGIDYGAPGTYLRFQVPGNLPWFQKPIFLLNEMKKNIETFGVLMFLQHLKKDGALLSFMNICLNIF